MIGVSGGPDSTALLYLLKELSGELGFSLHVAHLDHGLRKESRADRKFVEKSAAKLKLPFSSAEINIKDLAKRGSLEETCRNARLGFLFKTCRDTRADKLALAHNLDDQAETVLMRLIRGSGLSGLSGILPKRNISGYWVIRPLIEVRRREIELYLKKKKIVARVDKTNFDDIYLRNKIRKRLLLLLEKEYNPRIREGLNNLAENAGSDYDYLNLQAKKVKVGSAAKVNLDKLARLHPSLRRMVIRQKIASLQGDTRRITFKHIQEIEDLVLNRPVNSIVDLPKGLSVQKKKSTLSFYRKSLFLS